MSRARNIKPGFFENETLAEHSPLIRLLFIGLWCEADREGRLEYRPRKLRATIFPYDNVDVEDGIAALAADGFLHVYEADGKTYIQVVNWAKHQNPHHKEVASVIPAPPGHVDTVCKSYVPLNNATRNRIYARDGRVCRTCGAEHGLSIDHIIPVSRGGNSDDANLQVLCLTCNARKGNKISCTNDAQPVHEPCVDDPSPIENASCPTDSGFRIPDSLNLIPERAARAGAGDAASEVVVTDIHGAKLTSVIAELTPQQSAVVVTVCKALRKMGGTPRFHVGDELLAALAVEGFTAEQVARCAGEKALRDAGLWNDPDVHPDLFDLLVNGASQQEMGLTPAQYTSLRSAMAQVSIGYIASALRGRRRDASTQAQQGNNTHRGAARRPSAAENFEGKTYAGTAIDKLPAEYRDALERAGVGT